MLYVHDNNHNGQNHIADSHHRHQHRTYMGNTLNTAKHDKQAQNCQCNTHPYRIPAKGLLHGTTNGVSLD